jgi:hypothetical protein
MSDWALAVMSFLVGTTIAGLSGSIMEIVSGRPLGFAEPYVARASISRSLCATLAAGPMMLFNEALQARREHRVGAGALIAAASVAAVWACATGVVVIEVAWRMSRPIG